jgi:hypothetical protein
LTNRRSQSLSIPSTFSEVLRPRKDKRAFDLISDALPFDRLWCAGPNVVSCAIGYAKFYSRSHKCGDLRL